MPELTAGQGDQIEADLVRYLTAPMPAELRALVAGRVEAHTVNMGIRHSAVMSCIKVAWLVISDWLRDHPGDLAPPAARR
jgi:hypothetical protein